MKAMPAGPENSPGTASVSPPGDREASYAKLQQEMERLAYAMSHSLQSPLRAIIACCEEADSLPGDVSKEVPVETVRLLASESQRLKQMIQGLVDYMQLETHKVRHVEVDCNAVMDTVRDLLAEEITATGARITCERLPAVWGHQGRLTRLFAYLVDNAIKFRGKAPCAVIISATRKGDVWEFCVSDNGIGMDEDQQDVVFRLFKRLHTQEDYPGHGLGLALVGKIIDVHHGRYGVESAKGQGTRIWFTLPAHDRRA